MNIQKDIEITIQKPVQNITSNPTEKVQVTIDDNYGQLKSIKKPQYTFFLFVNPTSGGNKAAEFTKLDVERIIFSTFNPKDSDIDVCVYNMLNKENREQGLKTLKFEQSKGRDNLRVVVGGGDGTVLWVVNEMINAGVEINKCPIGIIPFGTGNDFSRVLGWGGFAPNVLIGTHLSGLKSMVNKWVDSIIEDFDIWDVTIETYEYGGIKQIYKEKNKPFTKRFMTVEHEETKQQVKAVSLKKKMCNYFSFGIDSRIGYGFDKKRTKSRCQNQMVYCCEGIKKLFLKTPKVNDVLEVIHQNSENINIHDPGAQQVQQVIGENFSLYPSTKAKNDKIAQNNQDEQNGTNQNGNRNVSLIKGNHAVFLCLNIPSYMGGASDPWHTSKGKVGVTDQKKSSIPDFEDQKFGDGKVELIGFMGSLNLAMERIMPGQGWRLGQVKGPFTVNFKQSPDPIKPVHTYMQVDGEFYDVIAPKSVTVCLTKDIPGGKIKVMVNPEMKKKKN